MTYPGEPTFRDGRAGSRAGLVLVWAAVVSSAPFVILAFEWHPHKFAVAGALAAGVILLLCKSRLTYSPLVVSVLALQIIGIALLGVLVPRSEVYFLTVLLQFGGVAVLYALIENMVGWRTFAKSYIAAILGMGVLGTIAFFLSYMGVLHPLGELPRPGEPGRLITNYGLTFTNAVYSFGDTDVIRYAGFFDEPGRMAFYLSAALLVNKCYWDNRTVGAILVVVGAFTFSLAFYVSVVLYIALFHRKATGAIFAVAFGCLVLVSILIGGRGGSPQVWQTLVADRVELTSGSSALVRGDNRTQFVPTALEHFAEAPVTGKGPHFTDDRYGHLTTTASIATTLMEGGLMGTGITFLHVGLFVLIALAQAFRGNTVYLKAAVVLCVLYLQRPYPLGPLPYITVLLLMVAAARGLGVLTFQNWRPSAVGR